MKSRTLLFSVITLLCFYTGTSQAYKVKEADKKFEKAAYADAREAYTQLVNKGNRTKHILQNLGDCYYFECDKENAVEWYAELITRHNDYDDEYLFRYAQSLKTIKLYDKAYDALSEYYQKKGIDLGPFGKNTDMDYVSLIERQSGRFKLLDFTHNSTGSDFSPQFALNKTLTFLSDRYVPFSEENKINYLLSTSVYEVSGTTLQKKSRDIDTEYNVYSLIYTKNGTTVYFSGSKKNNTKPAGAVRMRLYSATIENGEWKNIKKLPFNSNRYSVSYPALSPDEKKLFFVSDMPGNIGKYDIFAVNLTEDGTFGKPYNLGNTINTPGNETSPFIAKNGDLYFASDTHFGFGGYDIFLCKYKDGKYMDPVNLGQPVNSIYNDISLIIDNNTKTGFFASNRNAVGENKENLNIFKFKQVKDLILDCGQFIHGRITDSDTQKGVSSCMVRLLDEDLKEINRVKSDPNGYYKLNIHCADVHRIQVDNPSYYLAEKFIYTSSFTTNEIELPIRLNQGKGLIKTTVHTTDGVKIVELSPAYFDENATRIRPDAETEIQKVISVLTKNPELKIKIRSYTDHKGSKKYNRKLSKKRAIATRNYLVKKGKIASGRITIEAMGQSNPVAQCGNNCTENENRFNRRSEFIILK
ncbi:OmpA family protein [Abyssalbus ytuae]|uniref:OmpA family protein n=1 Tax=Abyssalbus ytuae TaxID=2926907 RepID=A0A9E7CTR3_9FLAO|nr:OmpA family protein [Abyssalbus ytuae]UOB16647.1 OmpA family protein [Abyssalbus ytuae]